MILDMTVFQLRPFRHDGNQKLEKKGEATIWQSGSWLIALPDEKFLVKGFFEGTLILLDYSTSAASININDGSSSKNQRSKTKEIDYTIQGRILTFAICGNCLAIEGLEREIRFYDL
jgi:hypothetical protein